jgi:exodeoxyribonuclease X
LRFFVCDTETTGPTPQDKVVELAFVELDADLQVLDRQHSLIDPQRAISASASGVHGITYDMLTEQPTLDEFFSVLYGSLLTGNVVFIAHNAQFDLRYLKPYIPTLAAEVCTLRLARKYFPRAENHKLSTLMYELGLARGTTHRADGDVDTTVGLLRKIVEVSGKSITQLAEDSAQPEFVAVMPFGKHKGLPVRDVPRGWFTWLLKQGGTIDRDLLYTINKVLAGA